MTAFFSSPRLRTLALAWALLPWLSTTAQAHEGHDDAPAAAVQTTQPRFVAASELFELVGLLDGQRVTLYLDHASDNRPVSGSQLTLDWGGAPLAVQSTGDGVFTAQLTALPPEGETAISATVIAGDESDLLAGTLDIHHSDAAPAATPATGATFATSATAATAGKRYGPIAAALVLGLIALGLGFGMGLGMGRRSAAGRATGGAA